MRNWEEDMELCEKELFFAMVITAMLVRTATNTN